MVIDIKELKPIPEVLTPASARSAGWAGHQERMIVVSVQSGEILVHEGHVCSFVGGLHPGADNITKTVIWSETPFCPCGKKEQYFDVRNPELLRFGEAKILSDPKLAEEWFGRYSPQLARRIAEALAEATSETAV